MDASAARFDYNRSPGSMTSVTEDKVKLCKSELYNFLDIYVDKDRGGAFPETSVAVVDGCCQTSNVCDREELTFLSNLLGVVDYKALTKICDDCSKMNVRGSLNVGINGHGLFCDSIIASQKIHGASMGEISLGDVRGISPSPKIALYVIGCPSCLKITEEDMVYGIKSAIQAKVSVISMSLAQSPAFMRQWPSIDFHGRDLASLDALGADIVTVVSAENLGKNHLKFVAKAAPWCLTIASCIPKRKFMSTLTLKSKTSSFEVQVESLYVFQGNEWTKLRRDGNIEDSSCIMYFDNSSGDFVIRKAFNDNLSAPSFLFVLYLSKEQSAIISNRLNKEDLLVQIKTASTAIVDTPSESTFSSRGPCRYYTEIMKPDLCAPREMIAASWPIKGVDCYMTSEFNVLSETSFVVPQVAAAIALLRAKTNFSAMETISAVITTATKMHGKDPIAREYAYGAGMLNVKKAMRPGLIYEESVGNYSRWFNHNLDHFLLNMPYFSATFPRANYLWECEFKRRVKSVENGRSKFKAKVIVHFTSLSMSLDSVRIRTSKDSLTFEKYGDEEEFSLLVSLPNTKQLPETFGLVSASLVWTKEGDERITVDSPIILSTERIPGIYRSYGMYVYMD